MIASTRIAAAIAPLLIVVACGEPAPRGQTEGQVARGEVDAATQAYADCVLTEARRMPIENGLPGELADRALQACPEERANLVARVRDFHQLGNPSKTAEESTAVAETSIKTLEIGLREQAVIAIGERQATARSGGAGAGAAAQGEATQ